MKRAREEGEEQSQQSGQDQKTQITDQPPQKQPRIETPQNPPNFFSIFQQFQQILPGNINPLNPIINVVPAKKPLTREERIDKINQIFPNVNSQNDQNSKQFILWGCFQTEQQSWGDQDSETYTQLTALFHSERESQIYCIARNKGEIPVGASDDSGKINNGAEEISKIVSLNPQELKIEYDTTRQERAEASTHTKWWETARVLVTEPNQLLKYLKMNKNRYYTTPIDSLAPDFDNFKFPQNFLTEKRKLMFPHVSPQEKKRKTERSEENDEKIEENEDQNQEKTEIDAKTKEELEKLEKMKDEELLGKIVNEPQGARRKSAVRLGDREIWGVFRQETRYTKNSHQRWVQEYLHTLDAIFATEREANLYTICRNTFNGEKIIEKPSETPQDIFSDLFSMRTTELIKLCSKKKNEAKKARDEERYHLFYIQKLPIYSAEDLVDYLGEGGSENDYFSVGMGSTSDFPANHYGNT